MKFIDEANIEVQAGKGGPGATRFRREKFVPMGGPDGGDGGNGGSIIVVADRNTQTLLDFKFKPIWKAEDGKSGEGGGRDGKSGQDVKLNVPVGTQILEPEGQQLVVDLSQEGQEFVLAKGGMGGRGNRSFKSATNRAPQYHQPGTAGESGIYLLSLKLVADIGLIGFPNAGKSTLISRISAARPRIADYPFTTLQPNLGVVQLDGGRSCTVADIPGLIPGAHEGRGLGLKFLKHVERTRLLAHLIDPNQLSEEGAPVSAMQSFEQINRELKLFSPELAAKPQIVVITKSDTITDDHQRSSIKSDFESLGYTVIIISSVSGEGLKELLHTFSAALTTA